jgi:hypothetical protein
MRNGIGDRGLQLVFPSFPERLALNRNCVDDNEARLTLPDGREMEVWNTIDFD